MNPLEQRRRRSVIEAAMACVVVLLVVQMWLLTATLESYLAGHRGVAGPAFAISVALFAICGGLYTMIARLDRAGRPAGPARSTAGPWRMGER